MKRLLLITIAEVLLWGNAMAVTVDSRAAASIAERFLSTKAVAGTRTSHPGSAVMVHQATAEMPLYVFNACDGGGYVVVSGDDRTRSILAYSDDGALDMDNMPDACRYWLSLYSEEIRAISRGHVSSRMESEGDVPDGTPVAPLVQTRWGQDYPYNTLCPMDNSTGQRSVTGCVATAMAQVMRHYSYPEQGRGSITYADASQKVERNLDYSSLPPFDWRNMNLIYGLGASRAEVDAVATLMMAAGFGVQMQYGSGVSLAYSKRAGYALIDYFGYSPDMYFYERALMDDSEWEGVILTELRNGRPVIYDCHNLDMDHTFVCDGYDGNGLYHFNWGFNGVGDGYFSLSSLNPDNQLTEGSGSGYSGSQSVICNIAPPGTCESGPQETDLLTIDMLYFRDATGYHVAADTPALTSRKEGTELFYNCFNKGFREFDGEIWAAEIQGDELAPLVMAQTSPIASGRYAQAYFPLSGAALADGSHDVAFVYRRAGSDVWNRVKASPGQPSACRITVAGDYVTLSPLESSAGGDSGVNAVVPDDDVRIALDAGTLTVASATDIADVSLFDITGRLSAHVSADSGEVRMDVSAFRNGAYVLVTKHADGRCRSWKILK